MIRTRLAIALAVTAASVALAPPAQAAGWVANSCAVDQPLHAVMAERPTWGGRYTEFIPCGQGMSGVEYVTAGPRPFYVNPEGPAAPFCMEAGRHYYPQASGAVITPTVRCR